VTGPGSGGRRLRVALVYGGRSAERDVSLMSARNVAAALDRGKYELLLVGIDAEGRWSLGGRELGILPEGSQAAGVAGGALTEGGALTGFCAPVEAGGREPRLASGLEFKGANAALGGIDVLFPLLHGPCGEDGSIQGLARLADLPCVGAELLGSALCMDKDAAKRIMRDAGIAVAPFMAFRSLAAARSAWSEVEIALGDDLFVKPANLGSSVGVSRARSWEEYQAAVESAFRYDTKIIVEKTIVGREIEVAVLGGRELRVSAPGEIVPRGGFYSYEAKYIDEEGAAVIAPAKLAYLEAEACRKLALDACEALCVRGMARVDMFLCPKGRPIANEVNTIPGFTSRSMYPLLWEASGLSLERLVDTLVEQAVEAHAERAALRSAPPVER
jgi:D-alanine-D-alanine ligase